MMIFYLIVAEVCIIALSLWAISRREKPHGEDYYGDPWGLYGAECKCTRVTAADLAWFHRRRTR